MKTIKTISVILLCLLISTLTANCKNKNTGERKESAVNTESVINVSSPPFKKFVVVTKEDEGLYKEADTNSPTLTRYIESDCESDLCTNIYQWSDQPAKSGFEISTDIMTWEGRVFPVLGEEGDFYKVNTLSQWCEIESAYIPKASVGDIEYTPIKADMLEAEDNYFKCRVMKDEKYKDIVLIYDYDELEGEALKVGILKDGAMATPVDYNFICNLDIEQKEDIYIDDTKGFQITTDDNVNDTVKVLYLNYNKSMATTVDGDENFYQLDLKKLNAEHIAKIVDTVTKRKPEYVICMYYFPTKEPESFYYKTK